MQPVPKEKKRRFRRWMWIPIGLVACFCSLVMLNAIQENRQSGTQIETVEFVADAGEPEGQADAAAENGPPPAESGSDSDKRAALENAQKNVEENPDDPFAYLDLAVIYIDLGDEEAAQETFAQGQELAGDNPDYFVVAGDLLAARERWLMALDQYLRAFDRGIGSGDRVFLNKVSQAAYFAAADPAAEEFFTRNQVIDRTNEIAQAVRARFLALHGNPEEALRMIEDELRLRPETPLYRLVHAEILKILGDLVPAEQILQDLIENGLTPSWIKVEARKMLNEINQ
jgi:Tfp pilus assembly protein PilF